MAQGSWSIVYIWKIFSHANIPALRSIPISREKLMQFTAKNAIAIKRSTALAINFSFLHSQ